MPLIPARHPVPGVFRLLALLWMLLSLLGMVVGVCALLYAGAWGCVGHAVGWFGCTAATAMLPFGSLVSFVVATTMLIFAQLFYLAGMKSERVEPRRTSLKGEAKNLIIDAVIDIFD